MENTKYLKEESHNLNLLYVEDNDKFRVEVSELLDGLFQNVYVASSVDKSIELFKEHRPQILIIDIEAWAPVAKRIKEIVPETRIIVLSKNDDKKSLLDAIDINVTKFLVRPVERSALLEVLELAKSQIYYDTNTKIFYTYLHSMINNQTSMVMMLRDKKALLVNQVFLDFFDVESINEFTKKHNDLGTLFLEKDGYLYNKANLNWLDDVSENIDKLYHVQLKDKNNEPRHFLFKYHLLPEEKSYAVLSFDDITELKLAQVNDSDTVQNESSEDDTETIYNLLKLIQNNKIKVHLYNYYKGLTIVHDGLVSDAQKDSLVIQTNYLQQKAIQSEEKTLISSEVLPYTIACNKLTGVSFERQIVKFKDVHFSRTSPASRKSIRLLPDPKYNVSLFIDNQRYRSNIKITDISIDSINLKFDVPPTNLKTNDKVTIDMILNYQNHPLIINTEATMLKKHYSNIVFVFNLDMEKKNTLLKYMVTRQKEIIREFKNLKDRAI